jgi:hypothetical protein
VVVVLLQLPFRFHASGVWVFRKGLRLAPGALSPFQALLSGQRSITAQGLTHQVADGGRAAGCHLLKVGPFASGDSHVCEQLPARFLFLAVGFRHWPHVLQVALTLAPVARVTKGPLVTPPLAH